MKWRRIIRCWKTCTAYVPTYSPMNAAVAHDNVCGAQTSAELRGHSEQAHSRSPAGGVLTGSSAAATDKTLHQTVQLVQSVKGTHQLGRNTRRGVSAGSNRWGKNTAKVFMSKVVHKKSRSADWEVLVLRCQVDSDCASNVVFIDTHWENMFTSAS